MNEVLDFDPTSGRLVLAPEAVAAGQAFLAGRSEFARACHDAKATIVQPLDGTRFKVEVCAQVMGT